jgi:hypothetical protein
MASAVNPFEREAKQHFSPDAVPIASLTCLVFSSSARCAPETGADANGFGPDKQMEGLLQLASLVSASAASLSFGGPPMIPPST